MGFFGILLMVTTFFSLMVVSSFSNLISNASALNNVTTNYAQLARIESMQAMLRGSQVNSTLINTTAVADGMSISIFNNTEIFSDAGGSTYYMAMPR